MLKNNALKAKDELLDYYEILISKLLKRMGKIAADYDEDAKSKYLEFLKSGTFDYSVILTSRMMT